MAGRTASPLAFQFLGIFFISTPAFQLHGSTSGDFHAVLFTARLYPYHLARQQFIDQFNQITTFVILLLQAFLQLKYLSIHDPKYSLYSTHPVAMTTAIASSVVYFFAYTALLRLPRRLAFLAHHLLVSSSYTAIAALASVALPDAAAPFVFAILGLVPAAEFIVWLHRRCHVFAEEDEEEAELWIRHFLIAIFGNLGSFHGRRTRRLPI